MSERVTKLILSANTRKYFAYFWYSFGSFTLKRGGFSLVWLAVSANFAKSVLSLQ